MRVTKKNLKPGLVFTVSYAFKDVEKEVTVKEVTWVGEEGREQAYVTAVGKGKGMKNMRLVMKEGDIIKQVKKEV